jgi:hypothetical protein
MDDRSIPVARWSVVRCCQATRHQRQLLARAYQRVFPQLRCSLSRLPGCDPAPCDPASLQFVTNARVAKGA